MALHGQSTTRSHGKRGSALTIGLAAAGVITFSSFAVLTFPLHSRIHIPLPRPNPAPLTAGEVQVVLRQIGLTPEALAATGASADNVTQVVGDVVTDLGTSFAGLVSARSTLASARTASEALTRRIQSGTASDEDRNNYPGALAAFTSAQTAAQAALDGIWSRSNSHLSDNQKTTIQNIQANAAWGGIGTQYLVVNRSESDWVNLRDAWTAARFANSKQLAVPDAAQTILSTADSDQSVSTAASGLGNLAAVKAAWIAASNPP